MEELRQRAWRGDDLDSTASWRVEYDADHRKLTSRVRELLERGPGFAVITGVPVAGLSVEQAQDFAPQLLTGLGQPLLQGPSNGATYGWLVRNEAVTRFRDDGSYREGIYTSKSSDHLDVHNDAAMQPYGYEVDFFGLLCVQSAARGGESILVSTPAILEVLSREYPEELERLRRPFAFERSHVTRPGQDPIVRAPVFSDRDGRLRVRCNRQRVEMAAHTADRPLRRSDVAALDALDEVLGRPEMQLRHTLNLGEYLVVDDHLVLHGRSRFVDDAEAGRQRCLVRVLLSRRASG